MLGKNICFSTVRPLSVLKNHQSLTIQHCLQHLHCSSLLLLKSSQIPAKATFQSNIPMALELLRTSKCFEGEQRYYTHHSNVTNSKMTFGIYLPPRAIKDKEKCPVIYFLNGLTATHENFIIKSGFQRFAARLGLCVVSPDTSPRDVDVPEHEYLGPGAGFYIDATQEPYAKHYQMFSYVTKELIELTTNNFPVIKGKQSISGFSMGGYGALICCLKNPGLYKSISVFAPLCNPMETRFGKAALSGYIGDNRELWKQWDPSAIAENYNEKPVEIFIEQGSEDEYTVGKNLLPENLIAAAKENDLIKIIFKEREGYDHSHFYVSTFVEEHMEYHAKFLNS